jgi:hypothetical protein
MCRTMCRRLLRVLSLFAALALSAFYADEAFATRRVALIIGNAKYEHAGVLANTLNDAHAVASLLNQAKFDVVEEHDDLSVVAMKRVVRDFAATARNADISVIYYSGHGIEAAGVNYLIPVDARLANAFDVEDETVQLDRLLWATSNVKALSLIILDACRENPFLHSVGGAPVTRGIGGHVIGQQATTANTLIAYAAKAGSLSYDGTDRNSPFTSALVKFIAEPGVDIRIALGRVRDDVLAATGNRQEPFVYGSLGGEPVSLTPTVSQVSSPIAATAVDYAMAERVGSSEAWRAFIQAHREGGFYVELARAQLNRTAPAPGSPPTQIATAPASPVKADAPAPSEDDRCKTEGARLTALRNDPSSAAISIFAAEMKCSALRPQLNRLMESVGLAAPATALAMTDPAARNPSPAGCEGEGRDVEQLRAEPDAAQAKALYDHLTCATLRPQLRRIMESLGVEPPPAAANPQLARAPQTASTSGAQKDSALCAEETSVLTRLRANPDRKSTIAFANAMRCGALKAQVARLLESLGD